MNARTSSLVIPAYGALLEGGYFHGIVLLDGALWGEVTAPKAAGEIEGLQWMPDYIDVPGASSDFDSLANTIAMAEAGSPLGQAARAVRHGGFDDWAVPARGSQLLQWSARERFPKAQRLARKAHWSSTQFSRNVAFYQCFDHGLTYTSDKSWQGGSARLVRRFPLSALAIQ